jgi:imidazolonepropionase-like amidohydrolase
MISHKMKIQVLILLALILPIFSCGYSQVDKITSEIKKQSRLAAFTDVNIISVRDGRVLRNRTVLVRDGKIEKILPSDNGKIGKEYTRIKSSGKYLMPGLADMHVYINNEYDMLLMLANGVTTARNMWGISYMVSFISSPDQKKLRDQVNEGDLIGPTIYTAGQIVDGTPAASAFMTVVKNEREAARAVKRQKDKGYDFIKIYDNLSVDLFNVVIKTAEEVEISVVGHVPNKVGLENALEAQMDSVEHLTGFIDYDSCTYIIPFKKIGYYARMAKQNYVYICPTLTLAQRRYTHKRDESIKGITEMKYVDLGTRISWWQTHNSIIDELREKYADFDKGTYRDKTTGLMKSLTKNLYSRGVKLLIGSNSGTPYTVPGFSLIDELNNFVSIGISPAETVKTATYRAALFLNKEKEFGDIKPGMRADLILLDGNPLENINNIKKRAGVMSRGLWISKENIQGILNGLDRTK